MKKSIKYIVLLIALNHTWLIKSLEAPDMGTVRTINPVTTGSTAPSKPKRLARAVAFELPTLNLNRTKKSAVPDQALVAEWGRPRRASSFSDLRELAASTQARPAPGVNRSVRVMLVPEPIDLSAQIDTPAAAKATSTLRSPSPASTDNCVLEIGAASTADSKETHGAHIAPKLTRAVSTHLSDTLEPVGALESTAPRIHANTHGHDPLVLALAASLKTYTEQNSEFLRNQAEQNKVAAEERNTTRRGVRDAKIIGAVATVGTLVGPYIAPYITEWVKSWI